MKVWIIKRDDDNDLNDVEVIANEKFDEWINNTELDVVYGNLDDDEIGLVDDNGVGWICKLVEMTE